jgi:predicted Rdx family selenoprotein
MNLVIHFNPSRGYEDEALSLARRLFAHFDEAIDSLAIIPVTGEHLDLWLDGRLIRSLCATGCFPRVADVREALS